VLVSESGVVVERTGSSSISSVVGEGGVVGVGHMDNLLCVYLPREVEVL
jgi:hypothetical protein